MYTAEQGSRDAGHKFTISEANVRWLNDLASKFSCKETTKSLIGSKMKIKNPPKS
jgi:hypothetical protein